MQSHGLWVSPDARAMPPATFPWRGLEPAPLRLLPHAKLRLASTQGLAPLRTSLWAAWGSLA